MSAFVRLTISAIRTVNLRINNNYLHMIPLNMGSLNREKVVRRFHGLLNQARYNLRASLPDVAELYVGVNALSLSACDGFYHF